MTIKKSQFLTTLTSNNLFVGKRPDYQDCATVLSGEKGSLANPAKTLSEAFDIHSTRIQESPQTIVCFSGDYSVLETGPGPLSVPPTVTEILSLGTSKIPSLLVSNCLRLFNVTLPGMIVQPSDLTTDCSVETQDCEITEFSVQGSGSQKIRVHVQNTVLNKITADFSDNSEGTLNFQNIRGDDDQEGDPFLQALIHGDAVVSWIMNDAQFTFPNRRFAFTEVKDRARWNFTITNTRRNKDRGGTYVYRGQSISQITKYSTFANLVSREGTPVTHIQIQEGAEVNSTRNGDVKTMSEDPDANKATNDGPLILIEHSGKKYHLTASGSHYTNQTKRPLYKETHSDQACTRRFFNGNQFEIKGPFAHTEYKDQAKTITNSVQTSITGSSQENLPSPLLVKNVRDQARTALTNANTNITAATAQDVPISQRFVYDKGSVDHNDQGLTIENTGEGGLQEVTTTGSGVYKQIQTGSIHKGNKTNGSFQSKFVSHDQSMVEASISNSIVEGLLHHQSDSTKPSQLTLEGVQGSSLRQEGNVVSRINSSVLQNKNHKPVLHLLGGSSGTVSNTSLFHHGFEGDHPSTSLVRVEQSKLETDLVKLVKSNLNDSQPLVHSLEGKVTSNSTVFTNNGTGTVIRQDGTESFSSLVSAKISHGSSNIVEGVGKVEAGVVNVTGVNTVSPGIDLNQLTRFISQ